MQHWRRLDMHLASLERVFALLKAGRSIETKIAIIAITTNNSISVNAFLLFLNAFNIPDFTIERVLSLIDDPAKRIIHCAPKRVVRRL